MAEKLPEPMVPRGPIDLTDDPDNPYMQEVRSSCQTCAYYHPKTVTCEAFPEGVPWMIIMGYEDHAAGPRHRHPQQCRDG